MVERIELRSDGGPLLGILVGGTAIEVKRGARMFAVDLRSTLEQGRPVIFERVLPHAGHEEEEEADSEAEVADADTA